MYWIFMMAVTSSGQAKQRVGRGQIGLINAQAALVQEQDGDAVGFCYAK
jgi:hypothetical protein